MKIEQKISLMQQYDHDSTTIITKLNIRKQRDEKSNTLSHLSSLSFLVFLLCPSSFRMMLFADDGY